MKTARTRVTVCRWYKCLIVSLVFSRLGFWSGNLFLVAPFPDLCLLVPFYIRVLVVVPCGGPKKSPRTSIYRSYFSNPQGLLAISLYFRFKPASNFVLLIVPRRYFCGGSFCFMSWCLNFFCAVGALCMFSYF